MNENDITIIIFQASNEEKELLKNFLALYLHDLSEFTEDLDIDDKGFFEYDSLDMYYDHKSLIPLLYKVNNTYAGFILLNKPPYTPEGVDYNINEFFILKKFRGKSIARKVIKELFRLFPGKYIVVQLRDNIPAINFWYKVYKENNLKYKENEINLSNEDCISQQFMITGDNQR